MFEFESYVNDSDKMPNAVTVILEAFPTTAAYVYERDHHGSATVGSTKGDNLDPSVSSACSLLKSEFERGTYTKLYGKNLVSSGSKRKTT